MSRLTLTLVALTLTLAAPNAQAAPQGAPPRDGVLNGSVWKNQSGKKVTVALTAQTSGDMAIDLEDQDGATGGTKRGTPASGRGLCESPPFAVGSDRYRARNYLIQWDGPNGWVSMSPSSGDGTVGSLPGPDQWAGADIQPFRLDVFDSCVVSLPA